MTNGNSNAPATKESIQQKLLDAVQELITLKVVTLVDKATVTIDKDGKATVTHDGATTHAALVSFFNLIDGDVTNVVAPSLKDDTALRDFHTAQVERALKVLPQNLKDLAEVVTKTVNALT